MTTPNQVAEQLVAQILTPAGLRAQDHIAEDTNFPAGLVSLPTIDYDNLDDSGITYTLDVFLFEGAQIGRHQKKLTQWMVGPNSIQARLQANRNLGFSDVDIHADGARPINLNEYASYRSYGAVVSCQVVIG